MRSGYTREFGGKNCVYARANTLLWVSLKFKKNLFSSLTVTSYWNPTKRNLHMFPEPLSWNSGVMRNIGRWEKPNAIEKNWFPDLFYLNFHLIFVLTLLFSYEFISKKVVEVVFDVRFFFCQILNVFA